LDKMIEDGTMDKLPKKEQARLNEERTKLDNILGGIRTMNGLPDALFIIDCKKEHIAIREAHRLEIPIVAVVDTNCDPDEVHYVIPGNDDAIRAVRLMAMQMAEAINEGRTMAQSVMEERAAQLGSAGAVSFGGGQIEFVGATDIELPPVHTDDEEEFDIAMAGNLSVPPRAKFDPSLAQAPATNGTPEAPAAEEAPAAVEAAEEAPAAEAEAAPAELEAAATTEEA
jgi:hypothetical protein